MYSAFVFLYKFIHIYGSAFLFIHIYLFMQVIFIHTTSV